MDWSKAKNIILILLILLNLFLFYNVLNVREPFYITVQYQNSAKQALQKAGVIVEGNIPSYNRPIGRISYNDSNPEAYRSMIKKLTGLTDDSATNPLNKSWVVNGRTLTLEKDAFIFTQDTSTLELPVGDDKKLDMALNSWIKDNSISQANFIREEVTEKNGVITVEYVQKYKSMPLFSNKIIFTIEQKKLQKVTGSLRVFDTIKLSKKDEIISANIVLLTGKNKVQGDVKSIDLGYLRLQNVDLYDTPVWRVTLSDGKKVWFNAYTGEWVE